MKTDHHSAALALSRRRQRGASMTEFIIISPIALLMMLGILQIGLVYMAKLTLNNATFQAARHGANVNANLSEINNSLAKGLIPFYIRSVGGQPTVARMTEALIRAQADGLLFTRVDLISPSREAYQNFGLDKDGRRTIPNDNIEYRLADAGNTRTGPGGRPISIRDANLLKIKVTYGYELKVPLIRTIMRKVMCLGAAGGGSVDAWTARNLVGLDIGHCAYYTFNRIPLVAYATVHMQSDAIEGASSAGGSGGSGLGTGTGTGGGETGGGDTGGGDTGGGDTGGGNTGGGNTGGGDTGGGDTGGGDTGGGDDGPVCP